MVKSLFTQHFRLRQTAFTKDEQTDLIKGKGNMFLYCFGKVSLTDASQARDLSCCCMEQLVLERRLLPARSKRSLRRIFALASRWGCILFLGEADIFLSARELMDFKRNGLVAVLRVLEYYTGILFPTTNRIDDFDEAFASRVHMSLYYPKLDEEKTPKEVSSTLKLTGLSL
ncbi:hypothetical protein BHE90_012906 [Fusarium euwallaceae]|uniref:ATPase AAA-type core domain-containing protein n=2 Tax=Fusarium solani species complex TaxID=232080 RepID=A0A430LAD0_9HYPO|nr:hypothetical protein BHE90_012906 [Fusarium euwallaceae]